MTKPWISTNRSHRPTTSKSNSERYGCSPINKKQKVMFDWVKQAQESKVPQLMKMAVTIMAYRTDILAWYDSPISTGKVERINNTIKVMKGVPMVLGMKDSFI